MRLILILLACVAGATLLPVVLTHLSYRVIPWSISERMERLGALACARVMGLIGDVAVYLRLWRLSELVSPSRFHLTARALGIVCQPCADEAPGWWDWEADCAGHECGTCETCVWHAAQASDTRPNRSRTHTEA